ncbi:class I SAM-dependent methyltransferase [Ginsengibacter hankyongi]|uniref:Class I SAM-dependent methyltransferase n=1 Tax=Ginsengibacter hankyongi TaxID=2607284 RepID=A0A5J5IHV2_9BACT|nr:class I SAM-dependent methyltransferase [Ginsengibacter hankyongi]KAA9040569.1 class I SAM-dependent methyltransferase [Ginsengibacter hankyongi]
MKISAIGIIIFIFFSFGKCNSSKTIRKPFVNPQYNYTYKPRSSDGTGKFYADREIAQVMGSEGAAWLDRRDRQKEENSRLAIEKMNLLPTSVVADIGAGTGYFTFKIAEKVPQGKVYAVEIQDELLRYLNNEKYELGDSNVVVIKGDVKSPHLPDSSIDLALLIDVYHELQYPREMMHSISKALKKNGKLLLLEYRAEDPKIPILPLHKMSVEQINKEMISNGFKLSLDGEFLPIQHFLLYEKINP